VLAADHDSRPRLVVLRDREGILGHTNICSQAGTERSCADQVGDVCADYGGGSAVASPRGRGAAEGTRTDSGVDACWVALSVKRRETRGYAAPDPHATLWSVSSVPRTLGGCPFPPRGWRRGDALLWGRLAAGGGGERGARPRHSLGLQYPTIAR
jgi:hypothetical protein